MPARLFLAVDQPWVDWGWLSTHVPYVWDAVVQHLELTVVAVVVGLAISLVLGVLAHLWRPLRFPVLTVFGAFYTIPSIALFALLIPITGLSGTSAEIPLIRYNVLILIRNLMVGLDTVPAPVPSVWWFLGAGAHEHRRPLALACRSRQLAGFGRHSHQARRAGPRLGRISRHRRSDRFAGGRCARPLRTLRQPGDQCLQRWTRRPFVRDHRHRVPGFRAG